MAAVFGSGSVAQASLGDRLMGGFDREHHSRVERRRGSEGGSSGDLRDRAMETHAPPAGRGVTRRDPAIASIPGA
jgi:hypothetical protein